MTAAIAGTKQDQLNRSMPAAFHSKLGDSLADLIANHNALLIDVTAMRTRMNSSMLSKAGLAIHGSASALVKAATACVALANGTPVYIAAATDMSALAGTLATAKSAAWAFYIDAVGTITTSAKTADVGTTALAIAALTAPPDNKAMIGFITIDNATGSDFTGGTTALDTGSLTVKYYDALGVSAFDAALTAVAVSSLEVRG